VTVRLAAVVTPLATACREPVLILPGGRLDGELHASPGAHASVDGFVTAQLETRPDDPYSVNMT
jgi:hypothetical protein